VCKVTTTTGLMILTGGRYTMRGGLDNFIERCANSLFFALYRSNFYGIARYGAFDMNKIFAI